MIPLTPHSGLIEWVKNTVTFKSFLTKVNRRLFGGDEDLLHSVMVAKKAAIENTSSRKANDPQAVATMSRTQVRSDLKKAAKVIFSLFVCLSATELIFPGGL